MNRNARIAFVTSIIVNVMLIGVILGQMPHQFDRGAVRQERMEIALKNLPEAAQNRLRDRYQQLSAAAAPLFEQIRQAQDDAVQLLGKEPFDERAYDDQVNKINSLRQAMTKKLSQVVKDASKDLSTEERRRFAELLRRPPRPPNP